MLSEKSQTKEECIMYSSIFIQNSRECKLIYSDNRSLVAWGREWGEGRRKRLQRSRRKLWGVRNVFILLMVVMISHVSKCAKLYTLNVCSLLYLSYTSIKL